MACKPVSLIEHLHSFGDLFNYDQLIGVTILKSVSKDLKHDFFDVFGFSEVISGDQVGTVVAEVRQRLAS